MANKKPRARGPQPTASYGPLAATILTRWGGVGDEVALDRIVSELADVKRYDIVAALKELEKADVGEFLVGQGGRRSRFVWNARPRPDAARRSATEPRAESPARGGVAPGTAKAAAPQRPREVASAPQRIQEGPPARQRAYEAASAHQRTQGGASGQQRAREARPPQQRAHEPSGAAPATVATLEHVFHVRPGFSATLRLPEDVTADEVERLSLFLQAIPFVRPRRSGQP